MSPATNRLLLHGQLSVYKRSVVIHPVLLLMCCFLKVNIRLLFSMLQVYVKLRNPVGGNQTFFVRKLSADSF